MDNSSSFVRSYRDPRGWRSADSATFSPDQPSTSSFFLKGSMAQRSSSVSYCYGLRSYVQDTCCQALQLRAAVLYRYTTWCEDIFGDQSGKMSARGRFHGSLPLSNLPSIHDQLYKFQSIQFLFTLHQHLSTPDRLCHSHWLPDPRITKEEKPSRYLAR